MGGPARTGHEWGQAAVIAAILLSATVVAIVWVLVAMVVSMIRGTW